MNYDLNRTLRALQVRAQKLDDQVKEMSAKIKELEAKLAETQNSLCAAEGALGGPPMYIKAMMIHGPHAHNKLYQDTREPDDQSVPHLLESIGTLAINSGEGASKYYGDEYNEVR